MPLSGVVWIFVIITLLSLTQIVHAADDSNSGDFSANPTPPPGGGSTSPPPSKPNPDDQSLATGLQKLNQGSNNTDVNKLIHELQNGNYTAAQSSIDKLKTQLGNPNSPAVSQLPTGLKDLLQSTSCTTAGCSVDWTNVSNMVQPYSTDRTGVPQGFASTNPASAASQLGALSTMSQHADPGLSLLFGSEARQILQYLESQPSDYTGPFQGLPPAPPLPSPSIGSIPPVTGTAGAFGVAPRALGGLPNIFSGIGSPNGLVLIPIIAIATGLAALVVFRKKSVVGLLKRRTLGVLGLDGGLTPSANFDPESPRHAIILSFRRAVGLMLGRGVLKMSFETHREFSTKCETRPERPYVGRISSIYERAVFSGRKVNQTHVEDARKQVTLIQECEPNKE